MKEFIEKLIGGLENEMKYCQFKAREARKKRTQNLISEEKLGYKQAQCFDTSIQIVKALAKALVEDKEYKGGCCEWEYVSSVSHYANIGCKNVERNIKSMRYYTYCPYCGKKIKVVE